MLQNVASVCRRIGRESRTLTTPRARCPRVVTRVRLIKYEGDRTGSNSMFKATHQHVEHSCVPFALSLTHVLAIMLDRATARQGQKMDVPNLYRIRSCPTLHLKIREKHNCRRPTFIIHFPFSVDVQLVRQLSSLALLLGTYSSNPRL